jgi:iron complex transport system ATP-binding protein
MNISSLQLKGLSAGYHPRGKMPQVVVQPFDRTVSRGQLICLIGPNGAGKSTLLRTIAAMQKPLQGQVLLDGCDIHQMSVRERACRLGVVLTQQMEVSLFTGYDLVAMGRHPHTSWMGTLSEQDHRVIRRSLALVGAEALSQRSFHTMSDGERQRIMIARALAQEPDLLLLDEPTAFLDLPRRVECMLLLQELAHRTGHIILLSTHDLELALRCADQIWLLPYSGQIRAGLPEELVLDGSFEAAFRNPAVSFDIETGAFRSRMIGTQSVILEGSGVYAIWTRRGLEREGYEVLSTGTPGVPIIRLKGDQPSVWELEMGCDTTIHHSLDALLTALRAIQGIVAV